MSLSRWDPFEGIAPLRKAVDRLMEEGFNRLGMLEVFGRPIPLDIRETANAYVIEASLPGMKPEDLEISATETTIRLQAAHTTEGVYLRRERFVGATSRVIELPKRINPDQATATFEHGVLTLRVPLAEEARSKRIDVQTPDSATQSPENGAHSPHITQ